MHLIKRFFSKSSANEGSVFYDNDVELIVEDTGMFSLSLNSVK